MSGRGTRGRRRTRRPRRREYGRRTMRRSRIRPRPGRRCLRHDRSVRWRSGRSSTDGESLCEYLLSTDDVGKSPSRAGREAVQEALDRRSAVSADQRDDVARVQAWSGLPLHQPAEVADEITRLAVVEDERGRVRRALHGPVDVERDEPRLRELREAGEREDRLERCDDEVDGVRAEALRGSPRSGSLGVVLRYDEPLRLDPVTALGGLQPLNQRTRPRITEPDGGRAV